MRNMNCLSSLFLLVLCVRIGSCGRVIFEDCGSAYDLQLVEISGCSRVIPCYLTVGVPTNVTAVFSAGYTSKTLLQNVYVSLNNVEIATNVSPTACEATWCPVNTSSSSTYEATMQLPSSIALNTRGNLIWKVLNENGAAVLCFNVVIQTRSLLAKLRDDYEELLVHDEEYQVN